MTSTLPRPSVAAGKAEQRRTQASRLRRRHRWLIWLSGVLTVALIGTGIWLVGFSSVLATQHVRVGGTDVLSVQQVRAAAQVPIGTPLARQDLSSIAARVAALPPVESVQVNRQWPDTVAIAVTERTGALALRDRANYSIVDRNGVVFRTVGTIPDGVMLAEIAPGNTPALIEVAEMAGQLPAALRDQVRTVQATSPISIVLTLRSGIQVTWGSADESDLKSDIVLALLDRKSKPRGIDVSAPHNPATR